MAWIIGIVAIILVVIFWRIFVPLGVLAVVVIGGILLYIKIDSDKNARVRERERAQAEQAQIQARNTLRQKIANARQSQSARAWEVLTETDPASGAKVPRIARIVSDDGLCQLQIEQRMSGVKLASVYCNGMDISPTSTVEVKFDNRPTSDKMKLEKFSSGPGVYIPSVQSGQLHYGEFLQRITTANKVALLLPVAAVGEQWFTFSLAGSSSPLVEIGAISSRPPSTTNTQPRTSQQIYQQYSAKSTQVPAQAPSPPVPQPAGPPSPPAGDAAKPRLPANATLNVYGNDWVCLRGYRRSGNECVAVELPANAQLNVYGNDWVCSRGFRRSGNECVAVQLPQNAALNVYGNDWVCARGFRRTGDQCVVVQIPANAQLNVYGNDWVCSRGHRRAGDECVAVHLPANSQLNVYGNDWVCARGYRRSGSECVAVGVLTDGQK